MFPDDISFFTILQYCDQIATGLLKFWIGETSNAMLSATLPKLENKHSLDTAHEKTLYCWNICYFRGKINLWFGKPSVSWAIHSTGILSVSVLTPVFWLNSSSNNCFSLKFLLSSLPTQSCCEGVNVNAKGCWRFIFLSFYSWEMVHSDASLSSLPVQL